MTLDRYMDQFGHDLTRAARVRTRRRHRARLAIAFSGAAALAVAVAVLPNANGVDAIAKAREALAPADEIVHMKVQMRLGKDGHMPSTEQWYGGNPARWRMVHNLTAVAPRAGKVRPMMAESIYSNGRYRFYDKNRDVVTIISGLEMTPMGGPSVLGGDPSTDVRALLAAGDVRDDGVVTVDGRQVRRLVSDRKDGGMERRLVYYMDPQTFAPVGGRVYFGKPPAPAIQFTVTGYERLPLNAETEKLLRFGKTPNTKYVWREVRRPR
ncbi:MAG TPA: hypothetical protein VFZ00_18025 [Solirubrobacter sp.]|nr:hypothetical protein [Solirubrobacter sp.]